MVEFLLKSLVQEQTDIQVDLKRGTFVIGRAFGCHGHLTSHFISKLHCRFQAIQLDDSERDACASVVDCSQNGTFRNGVLIGRDVRAFLKPGDLLSFLNAGFKDGASIQFVYRVQV